MSTRESAVLVAGAGPVGLTAALGLRALDVPVTVLEAEAEDRVRPGSRALFVHHASLRRLAPMDPVLAADIAAHGVVWRSRRTFFRGRQVFGRAFPAPPQDELPPFTSLRQVDTERHLLAACRRAGVRFAWNARVTGVESGEHAVTVMTQDDGRHEAAYLVAADGGRSAVRRALGIEMSGGRGDGFHVVVDTASAPGEQPLERVFHYEHPRMDGRNVLLVPFAGGLQVDLQCRADDRPEAFASEDAARAWLPRVLGSEPRILWASTYHFLQVVARRLTDEQRRVLLTGDAAHLFAPFGARGMNSGIADADAAAVTIATALRARSATRARSAVDDYARRRRSAAEANRRAAGQALAHMQPRSPGARLRRRGAAALARAVPALGLWLERAPYGPRLTETADGY